MACARLRWKAPARALAQWFSCFSVVRFCACCARLQTSAQDVQFSVVLANKTAMCAAARTGPWVAERSSAQSTDDALCAGRCWQIGLDMQVARLVTPGIDHTFRTVCWMLCSGVGCPPCLSRSPRRPNPALRTASRPLGLNWVVLDDGGHDCDPVEAAGRRPSHVVSNLSHTRAPGFEAPHHPIAAGMHHLPSRKSTRQ